jgi:hypothetical protein
MHMGPHAASVISTDLAEATCGPICILTKPNNETCKIANPSPCALAPPGLYAYKSHLPPSTTIFFFPHHDAEQHTLVGRLHPWASRATQCSPSANQVAALALRPLPCWAATSWTLSSISSVPMTTPVCCSVGAPWSHPAVLARWSCSRAPPCRVATLRNSADRARPSHRCWSPAPPQWGSFPSSPISALVGHASSSTSRPWRICCSKDRKEGKLVFYLSICELWKSISNKIQLQEIWNKFGGSPLI